MINNIRDLLILHEARRKKTYYDSAPERYVTGGIGFLLDPRLGATIPDAVIDLWFDILLKEAEESLPQWATKEALGDVRHAVLVDMRYNLGPEPFDGDGFKDWPLFVQQVKAGDWEGAAINMKSTKWSKQVGPRAARLALMMESGKWPTN